MWMDGWMDEWMDGWKSCFKRLLTAILKERQKETFKEERKIGVLQNPFLLCCVDACGTERTSVLGTKLCQQKMYYIFRIIVDTSKQKQLI